MGAGNASDEHKKASAKGALQRGAELLPHGRHKMSVSRSSALQEVLIWPFEHEASASGFGRGVRIAERRARVGAAVKDWDLFTRSRSEFRTWKNWEGLQQTRREKCCRASSDSDAHKQNRGRVVPDVEGPSGVRDREGQAIDQGRSTESEGIVRVGAADRSGGVGGPPAVDVKKAIVATLIQMRRSTRVGSRRAT